jgi:UDP-N-acetyl-2-amino-2-deoxyglucuronate dehydrogenase
MINFALIGCGRIAKRHAELLGTGQIQGAGLVAVCDVQRKRAPAFGAQYTVPAFGSIQEMLGMPAIDAVSVLTPSGMQAEHAILVARSNRHVFVEKPMALAQTRRRSRLSSRPEPAPRQIVAVADALAQFAAD